MTLSRLVSRVCVWMWLGVLAFIVAPQLTQAQVPAKFVDALRRGSYTLLSGDVNSDGIPDILARAKPNVVPIDLDGLSIPIVFYVSPTFALLSQPGGNYSLLANPSASIRNHTAWQATRMTPCMETSPATAPAEC
jgi:hypothetical protein